MGATNFSGPLNVYNAAPNNGIGSALDYNDSGGGPSLFFAGSGIMDPRPFYQYVPGGVRGGYVHGATDEYGFAAVENKVHVHDLHATILQLLGFDHEKLTFRHSGRDFRLTDVHGRVVRELIA